MKVLCFGIAKDIVGGTSISLDNEELNTVSVLRNYLTSSYPKFKDYTAFRIAVNQAFAEETDAISSKDEIAIIPPVSGG